MTCSSGPALRRRLEKVDQVADGMVAVLGVAKRKLVMDLVAVPASIARLRQVPRTLELTDDLSDGSLCDTDRLGDIAQPCVLLVAEDLEHVSVVGHEAERVICFT